MENVFSFFAIKTKCYIENICVYILMHSCYSLHEFLEVGRLSQICIFTNSLRAYFPYNLAINVCKKFIFQFWRM